MEHMVTVTFKVTVDKDANAVTLENQANVNDGENDYGSNVTKNPTTPPTPPVIPKPMKEVFNAKDTNTNIDGKTVKAGDELIYRISYTNNTDEEETVTITDTVPKNTKFVSVEAGGVEKNGTITLSDVKVAAGDTITVSFKVKVEADNGVSVDNTAKVIVGDNVYTTNKTTNPTGKVTKSVVKKLIKKVKTGDSTSMMILSIIAIAAFGTLIAVANGRRRKAGGR